EGRGTRGEGKQPKLTVRPPPGNPAAKTPRDFFRSASRRNHATAVNACGDGFRQRRAGACGDATLPRIFECKVVFGDPGVERGLLGGQPGVSDILDRAAAGVD